jgi:hypothetical protein
MALPPRQRQVAALRILLELNTDESARILGISNATGEAICAARFATLTASWPAPAADRKNAGQKPVVTAPRLRRDAGHRSLLR